MYKKNNIIIYLFCIFVFLTFCIFIYLGDIRIWDAGAGRVVGLVRILQHVRIQQHNRSMAMRYCLRLARVASEMRVRDAPEVCSQRKCCKCSSSRLKRLQAASSHEGDRRSAPEPVMAASNDPVRHGWPLTDTPHHERFPFGQRRSIAVRAEPRKFRTHGY